MADNFYASMYGSRPLAVPTAPSEIEREKRAVKVLGGMKITNSHMKRVLIDDQLVDVPKVEYVQLLEGQIKETRQRLRDAEVKIYRLQNIQTKMMADIRDLKREISTKITLR